MLKSNKTEIHEEYLDFLEIGKECTLNILRKLDTQSNKIIELKREDKENFELDEQLSMINEDIKKYVELFKAFSLELQEQHIPSEEDLKKAEEIVSKMLNANSLTVEHIREEIEKRKKYSGSSGAEVVRNFLEYQQKELLKMKNALDRKMLKLLADETALKMEFESAVTEEESRAVMEKIINNEKETNLCAEKIAICIEKTEEIKADIEEKWKYEIYGTISKEELRNKI